MYPVFIVLFVRENEVFVTVKITSYNPLVVYWCCGFCCVLFAEESPNDHIQVLIVALSAVDESENDTSRGTYPDVGRAENEGYNFISTPPSLPHADTVGLVVAYLRAKDQSCDAVPPAFQYIRPNASFGALVIVVMPVTISFPST
jgi:hypothetical protein